jgi:hypothetical protein
LVGDVVFDLKSACIFTTIFVYRMLSPVASQIERMCDQVNMLCYNVSGKTWVQTAAECCFRNVDAAGVLKANVGSKVQAKESGKQFCEVDYGAHGTLLDFPPTEGSYPAVGVYTFGYGVDFGNSGKHDRLIPTPEIDKQKRGGKNGRFV